MGSDEAKIEKKRLKAEQKMAKKAAKKEEKAEGTPIPGSQPVIEKEVKNTAVPPKIIVQIPKSPWYKDPKWISVIIGAISLSLALISIFTDWI